MPRGLARLSALWRNLTHRGQLGRDLTIATIATLIPATQAIRLDPMVALRSE